MLNMLSLVAENYTSGVFCFDNEGKCIYTNDKAWELLGVEKKRTEYKELFQAPDMKVMVVDDNDVNCMVFCQLLKRTKIQIQAVESGEKCLEYIQKEHYDLIFMDYMMPGMDGVETLHRMKTMEHRCKNTPVIMLTANALVGNKEKYLKEGFDGFLAKPIHPEELESMIQEYVSQGTGFPGEVSQGTRFPGA